MFVINFIFELDGPLVSKEVCDKMKRNYLFCANLGKYQSFCLLNTLDELTIHFSTYFVSVDIGEN